MARARPLPNGALKGLDEYGIRYKVVWGELFIDGRDWRRYNRLCDEGKLPSKVC
ncbi:MAG: hypothetical protein GSR85_01430 [Desulfurococcales archaeon]|nr:hypothetical protein [Desulfurococcales archaeon]